MAKGIKGFKKIVFNSNKDHNPEYDILEGHINDDTFITYYKKVKGENVGAEGMEYYTGENFVVGSNLKSFSRNYEASKIPKKHKAKWLKLKEAYETKSYSEGGEIMSEDEALKKYNATSKKLGEEHPTTKFWGGYYDAIATTYAGGGEIPKSFKGKKVSSIRADKSGRYWVVFFEGKDEMLQFSKNPRNDEVVATYWGEATDSGGRSVVDDLDKTKSYAGGGEIENASDLYDKHFEKYPYATELIAHYIFGVDEDNDVYNASIGKYGKPVDTEPYSALMLEYEYSWNENLQELNERAEKLFNAESIETGMFAKGGSMARGGSVRSEILGAFKKGELRNAQGELVTDKNEAYQMVYLADLKANPNKYAYAGGGEINGKYLDSISDSKKSRILKNIANHYGISESSAEDEVRRGC
jgi:hypothetical protein